MPGFDGTGPRGRGALSGGGRGFCVAPVSGAEPRLFGRGCGRGWRNQLQATGFPRWARGADSVEALKAEAAFLQEQLKAVQERLDASEKE